MASRPVDTPRGAAQRAVRPMALAALAALVTLASACGGDYSPQEDPEFEPYTTKREVDPQGPSVFGQGGLAVGTVRSTRDLFGGAEEEQGRLPVNKYLWQGALDTLSFLPLASSDPFTGVVATDWGATPEAPTERFKVTAFVTSPVLSAASLKVAVYREVRNDEGVWVPAPVSPETARKLEDAILTRAREIRIAEREGRAAG